MRPQEARAPRLTAQAAPQRRSASCGSVPYRDGKVSPYESGSIRAGRAVYPSQRHGWTMVSLGKLGAWFLLMIISYVLVALVNRPQAMPVAERSAIGTLDKMVPAAMTVYSGS